jgi:hypothetical protein
MADPAITPAGIVRSVEDLAASMAAVKAAYRELKEHGRAGVEAAARIGAELARVQGVLKEQHSWLAWLKKAGLPRRTATDCLTIHSRRPEWATVAHLGVRGVLEFLRSGRTGEEEDDEAGGEAPVPPGATVETIPMTVRIIRPPPQRVSVNVRTVKRPPVQLPPRTPVYTAAPPVQLPPRTPVYVRPPGPEAEEAEGATGPADEEPEPFRPVPPRGPAGERYRRKRDALENALWEHLKENADYAAKTDDNLLRSGWPWLTANRKWPFPGDTGWFWLRGHPGRCGLPREFFDAVPGLDRPRPIGEALEAAAYAAAVALAAGGKK